MIPDRAQRRLAVLTPHHAFVWASAGTGKTHTLSLRALYLLLTLPQQPLAAATDAARLYVASTRAERLRAARAVLRRLVLTTFTRKAAAEMQTRLYEYLDRLASSADMTALQAAIAQMHGGHGDEQFQHVVEAALAAAGNFQRLRAGAEALAELATELPVCTIHSYAAAILRRHPIAAGLSPNAQFIEEDDSTAADPAEQLVDRWWSHALADPQLHEQLKQILTVVPLQHLRDWLVQIVHEPWIVEELDFGSPDDRQLTQLLEATERLVSELQTVRENAGNIIAARDALANVVRQVRAGARGAWLEFCQVLVRHQDDIWGKTKTVRAALSRLGKLATAYASFESAYIPVLQQCLASDRAELWRKWQTFAQAFAAWADGAVVRELNVVTFDEMVHRAARLLATNPEVRRIERERLSALLVDEFQDTDPVQLELLSHLLRRNTKQDHEVIGFFVGDSKQSIYRFRKADLAAIQQFARHYAQLVQIPASRVVQVHLTASFRSQPAVLRFVNHFFLHYLPLPNYDQEQLQPVRTDDGPRPEWRLLIAPPDAKSAERLKQAAVETARLIHEHVQQADNQPSAYSDVLVLVRTHQELNALLPVLEQAQIPVVSSGAKTFYQKPEVLDVLNLLIALYNPQDSLALGALLRSPLIGLADPIIHDVLAQMPLRELMSDSAKLPDAFSPLAQQRITTLRRLAASRTQKTFTEWLDQVRAFVPAAVYTAQDAEGRAIVRIEAVLNAFRRVVEQGRIPPLVWLLDQRARVNDADRFDAELGEDVSVTDESVAAVRVMTIHKAKGLEGRFVIVYGWQKTLSGSAERRNTKPAVIRLTDAEGKQLSGLRMEWGDLLIVSPGYPAACTANKEADAAEARRLAYVAATRARDRLVLLTEDSDELLDGGDGAEPLAKKLGDTASITQVENPVLPRVPAAAVQPPLDQRAYESIWNQRLGALTRPLALLLHRPTAPELPAEDDATESADYSEQSVQPAQATARTAGILVHQYLEQYLTEPRFDPKKLTAFDLGAPSEAITRAASVLKSFYGSARHKLVQRSRLLGREVPLFLQYDGAAWHGVVDLILETADGILAVDYKVMQPPGALLPEQVKQQRLYTEALRRVYADRPVRFEFWWLTADR